MIIEKVKFVEISTLSTDFYEENHSETAVHRCSIRKLDLKISELTRAIRPKCDLWTSRKKWHRMPTEFLQKKPKYFPGIFKGTLKKHGFYTSEIIQKPEHFVQQLRCYNLSNWTYRFKYS